MTAECVRGSAWDHTVVLIHVPLLLSLYLVVTLTTILSLIPITILTTYGLEMTLLTVTKNDFPPEIIPLLGGIPMAPQNGGVATPMITSLVLVLHLPRDVVFHHQHPWKDDRSNVLVRKVFLTWKS